MATPQLAFIVALVLFSATASADKPDADRDILVTFVNDGAMSASAGFRAPYQTRRRYAISAKARRDARAVRSEYGLSEVDHWPIRSLSVYCFVYRVPDGEKREDVLVRLRADNRVESAQPLQVFESGTRISAKYDDKFANLQHGLDELGIGAAHRYSRGTGVRIAVIDSHYDVRHEDLKGRVSSVSLLTDSNAPPDDKHGTAVISVIGAHSNNAVGIVGIAPDADLQLFVSCWASARSAGAVCDSFTLAKALDLLIEDPPDILNMSLTGPYDPLVGRLLQKVHECGVVVIAATANETEGGPGFPASLDTVIGVSTSPSVSRGGAKTRPDDGTIFAPGDQILVAVPDNAYDFRSGTSLAAAHVSGAVALLLAISPDDSPETVQRRLRDSQEIGEMGHRSINACGLLKLANRSYQCQ